MQAADDTESPLTESLKTYVFAMNSRPALSEITVGLLHKFNNAVTGVAFLAENCVQILGEGHPVRRELAEIGTVLQKAQRFVDLIVELHLAEPTEAGYFALDTLLDQQMDMVRALITKGTSVQYVPPPSDMLVHVPERLFRQVLVHLVQNADEAMIGAENRILWITHAAGSQTVSIVVRDNGPGIAAEALPHLFEPFHTTKERRKHAGVGTYLARQIALSCGWELTGRNHPDGGTEFTLNLPLADSQ